MRPHQNPGRLGKASVRSATIIRWMEACDIIFPFSIDEYAQQRDEPIHGHRQTPCAAAAAAAAASSSHTRHGIETRNQERGAQCDELGDRIAVETGAITITITITMPTFQNKTFRSSADAGKIGMKYRSLIGKHPFLTFGLPFIAVIVAGSFVLTPATAIRYEKHDRKVRQLTKDEELNVRRAARKVDMKEEYYVSFFSFFLSTRTSTCKE